MFDRGEGPHLFGMPPGADFPASLVSGLRRWAADRPPEALARVTLYVNTRRMARRIEALFDEGPPVLLPRIHLVGDLGRDTVLADVPPAASPLKRRIEIVRLVSALIDAEPSLAPRATVYDLADSLAGLLDEMEGEGIAADALLRLDASDQSGHWARSLKFLKIVQSYLNGEIGQAPDTEARRALAVARLGEHWKSTAPADPVIVAGSTGSRGTTAEFMTIVAGLPHGAVLLPGFDFDTPDDLWGALGQRGRSEDHPQARFALLLNRLGVGPDAVRPWPGAAPPNRDRNRLVSLALRPAPVTDQWLTEGPALGALLPLTSRLSIVEAPTPRAEALAIALAMRDAVENGRRVALVTPDRVLSRRVAATLDRWSIVPDDSAGRPLALTPPGRFVVQVGSAIGSQLDTVSLLSLLKHPLTNSGAARGSHLLHTRRLELHLRRKGVPFPEGPALLAWAAAEDDVEALRWMTWLADWLERAKDEGGPRFVERLGHLMSLSEALARGLEDYGTGMLWEEEAGRRTRAALDAMARDADAAGEMDALVFRSVFEGILGREEVRDTLASRPDAMIWGTLEARVQGADVIILGGLNEGVWPQMPAPDPWLNRTMRARSGMLLPDRRIGLSAHDFQQAIAAPEAILSRAVKGDDAQTVPSRWLNRLTNLLGGLDATGGPDALREMRRRGDGWLALAARLDQPEEESVQPAHRPSPVPPVGARPHELPVTSIQTLIRDPYAVYARRVLDLHPVGVVIPKPDPALRGQVFHEILRRYMTAPGDQSVAALMEVADEVLTREVPWPLHRRLWRARMEDLAPWFIAMETTRGGFENFMLAECPGGLDLANPTFSLTARADRIDRLASGALVIIDYKTGMVPGEKEIEHFDKQLLLEALIAEEGGFADVPPAKVAEVVHIGLGSKREYRAHRLVDTDKVRFSMESVRAGLGKRIRHLLDPDFGFAARVAIRNVAFESDYDHLSRYGEWDTDAPPKKERVG